MEEKRYPPKVRAMFEAVLELFASGRELSTLKVSEITARAGIGKGTAYEYFSTKEEIIVGAIEYEATKHFQVIIKLLEEGQTLPEILSRGLDMLEAANEKYHGLTVLEKIISDSTINGGILLKEIEKYREEYEPCTRMTQRLMKLVKDSGGVLETSPWKVWGAILSQYMLYAFYLVHRERMEVISREEARSFVYQNILKILDGTT
ncbi:MAG: TetR/AcrR family transcriptional regulator [Lachnospiraceae bacterium]|nr:TetR/AcrR family transcriptional regulator [Lachnospiraceae bacterium]